MGYGTTRTLERVAAAIGMLDGAPIEFEQVQDVPDGGVLFALPALLENGLLSGTEKIYTMPEGFYPIETIFLLLALMALARIASVEALRYVIAGEWGKLLGLDRIPEVRTLRQKISQLCSPEGRAERWSSQLARQWMADCPQSAGVYYADGHVSSITANLQRCRGATLLGSGSACAAPPTIGLTPWTGAPFLSSAGRSIRAC
jgi:transposase-like protein